MASATVVAGLLVAAVSGAVVISVRASHGPARGVERAEAEGLLARAVRLARAGDLTGLCRSVADAPGPCRSILDYTRSKAWVPGVDAPVVVEVRRYPGSDHGEATLVLRVAGSRADSSHYETDFPVIRNETGAVKGIAPVYWSGMSFDGSRSTCDHAADEACARYRVATP